MERDLDKIRQEADILYLRNKVDKISEDLVERGVSYSKRFKSIESKVTWFAILFTTVFMLTMLLFARLEQRNMQQYEKVEQRLNQVLQIIMIYDGEKVDPND